MSHYATLSKYGNYASAQNQKQAENRQNLSIQIKSGRILDKSQWSADFPLKYTSIFYPPYFLKTVLTPRQISIITADIF